MKAISLWQPFASAIPLGFKKFETRHWKTSHRGPIAIHAAKKRTDELHRLAVNRLLPYFPLPFGKIIAIANLQDIYDLDLLGLFVSPMERSWGDYSPRRYGWSLVNIKPLKQPFDYRGGQGIFNVPDEMILNAL